MTDECCKNCYFWKAWPTAPEAGTCQRYPPLPDQRQDADRSHTFPRTLAQEWCGEFQDRSPKEASL